MGKINWNRVILGGLVAGAIVNIFEFLLKGVVLAKDMEAAVSALGRQLGGGALAMFSVWGFLVGIFAVWLYAAIRPRYGDGQKTALCAGAAVWGLGYLLASVGPPAKSVSPRGDSAHDGQGIMAPEFCALREVFIRFDPY